MAKMIKKEILDLFDEILENWEESERACIFEGLSSIQKTDKQAIENLEQEIIIYKKRLLYILQNFELPAGTKR